MSKASKESPAVETSKVDLSALLGGKAVKIVSKQYLYKFEIGLEKQSALVGHLIGLRNFESKDSSMPDYQRLVVRTTQPCWVAEGDKGDSIEVPAGSDIMVKVNHNLQTLVPLALERERVRKVAILPTKKEKIGNGKELWNVEVATLEETFERALIAPETVVAALPAAPEKEPVAQFTP